MPRRLISAICMVSLMICLAACGRDNPEHEAGTSGEAVSVAEKAEDPMDHQSITEKPIAGMESSENVTREQIAKESPAAPSLTIYIGSGDQFDTYTVGYSGSLTATGQIPAEKVIEALADYIGWNLDLSGAVSVGKGGIAVSFAQTATLFTGAVKSGGISPSGTPKELDQTLLDSVRKTLQCWAVDPQKGDPEAVDIWFSGPDGGDLVLENIGVVIPFDQPYRTFPAD
ncbi:MAG: hypothetical protein ACLU8W_08140 [Clostridia bacterium]